MTKTINQVFTLLLFAFLFSCGDDDNTSIIQLDYEIDLSRVDVDGFVLITNQDKDVLYAGQGSNLATSANFTKKENDIIDFTYGHLNKATFFKIITYRNIGANFVINSQFKEEDTSLNQSGILADRVFEISNFTGEVVLAPFRDVEVVDDNLRLATFGSDQSMIVTVLDEACTCHKSIKIDPSDWELQDDGSYFHSETIDNFEESIEHKIQLSHSASNWMVNADAQLEDDSEVVLAKWSNYRHYQSGAEIRVFTTPGLDIKTLSLSTGIGNINESLSYNKVGLSELPNEINFTKMTTEYESVSPASYTLKNPEQYDMASVKYLYSIENYLSFWTVFQSEETGTDYMLPTIPEEFFEEDNLVMETIANPEDVIVEYYRLQRPIGPNGFVENREARVSCEDYTSSTDSYEF